MKTILTNLILALLLQASGFAAIVLHVPDPSVGPLGQWNAALNLDSPPFFVDLNVDGTSDLRFNRDFVGAELLPTGSNRIIAVTATATDGSGTLGGAVSPVEAGSILGGAPEVLAGGWQSAADIAGSPFILGVVFAGRPDFTDPAVIARLKHDFVGMQLSDAYIGVEFQAEDGVHYGWVRYTGFPFVKIPAFDLDGQPMGFFDNFNTPGGLISAWAYETEPGKAIIAGAVPEPGTSLLLAIASLALLRRKR